MVCYELSAVTESPEKGRSKGKRSTNSPYSSASATRSGPLNLEYISTHYNDVFSDMRCLPGEYCIKVEKRVKPVNTTQTIA